MSELVASFAFECGSPNAQSQIKDWINGSDAYPPGLKDKFDELDFDSEMLEAANAYTERNWISIEIYQLYVVPVIAAILDYAMKTMPEVPSPQGFIYGDSEFYGGAVVIKRGFGWKQLYNGAWLDEELQADEVRPDERSTCWNP